MERIKYISKALKNHPVRIIEPGGRAHASVALIMEERSSGLNILFIKRSTNENDYWSGQIGLPGGRSETTDKGPGQTAERETQEELGLDLSAAQFLGRLSDIAPGGLQIVVSCFVYAVRQRPVLRPDKNEIAGTFWVPARELNNPALRTHVDIIVRDRLRRFSALKIVDDYELPLWGITYRLLRNFNKVIQSSGDQDRSMYKECLR